MTRGTVLCFLGHEPSATDLSYLILTTTGWSLWIGGNGKGHTALPAATGLWG